MLVSIFRNPDLKFQHIMWYSPNRHTQNCILTFAFTSTRVPTLYAYNSLKTSCLFHMGRPWIQWITMCLWQVLWWTLIKAYIVSRLYKVRAAIEYANVTERWVLELMFQLNAQFHDDKLVTDLFIMITSSTTKCQRLWICYLNAVVIRGNL